MLHNIGFYFSDKHFIIFKQSTLRNIKLFYISFDYLYLLPELIYWTSLCYGTRGYRYARKYNAPAYLYYIKVWYYTEQNANKIMDINKRGMDYHIDHIVPLVVGYNNLIPPEILGGVENLQILSAKDNLSKNNKITDKALELLYKWRSANLFEYK